MLIKLKKSNLGVIIRLPIQLTLFLFNSKYKDNFFLNHVDFIQFLRHFSTVVNRTFFFRKGNFQFILNFCIVKICTYHIIYRYIELLNTYFNGRPPSSSEGKIGEGDNFQNYGRKDQCIYI